MKENTRIVDISDLKLNVLTYGNDALWYGQRGVFEERNSQLYKLIRKHNYKNFLDVGANYGFISMLAKLSHQSLFILCIEADPRISKLIKKNFELNNLDPPEIINAVASNQDNDKVYFSLNPKGTLDNRVEMKGWEKIDVKEVNISRIISSYNLQDRLFIKIDVQGFEDKVINGLMPYLRSHNEWMIKTEFAPFCLDSQGANPSKLLSFLVNEFEVCECPARIPYQTRSLDELFENSLLEEKIPGFLSYVQGLNAKGTGWLDLLVRPKK